MAFTLRYDPMIVADDRRGAMMDVRAVKDRHSSLSSAWRRREAMLSPVHSVTLSGLGYNSYSAQALASGTGTGRGPQVIVLHAQSPADYRVFEGDLS